MTKPCDIVWVVVCIGTDGKTVHHIFKSERAAKEYAHADVVRAHVIYDYALDCPERHEGAPQ